MWETWIRCPGREDPLEKEMATPPALLTSLVAQVVKASACNVGDLGSMPGSEDPLEKEMATPPVLLPGESHGQRSRVGYSPWGCRESDTSERLHVTHRSVWNHSVLLFPLTHPRSQRPNPIFPWTELLFNSNFPLCCCFHFICF